MLLPLGGGPARGALALVRIEVKLAQADGLGRHLHQLVIVDIGDRLLKRQPLGWGEAQRIVLAAGTEVGELLGLERIDLEIVGLGVLTDHHAFRSEEHTSELQSLMRTSYAVYCLKKKKK